MQSQVCCASRELYALLKQKPKYYLLRQQQHVPNRMNWKNCFFFGKLEEILLNDVPSHQQKPRVSTIPAARIWFCWYEVHLQHTYTGQPPLYWAGEQDSHAGCVLYCIMCYADLLIHLWCPAAAVHMCLCKQVCIPQTTSWCITGVTAGKVEFYC